MTDPSTGGSKTRPWLLSASDLAHRYPSPPRSDDAAGFSLATESFSLNGGELVTLVGPNGAGKSTLLKILAGRIRAQQGEVTLDGRPLRDWRPKERARVLGYLPQRVLAEDHLTVLEMVRMGRYPHSRALGLLGPDDLEAVRHALSRMQVAHLAERRLGGLSGGERRRCFLASVLAQQPRVLLLDEPTAGLDPHQQSVFFARLEELAGLGMGILVVTHELNIAALHATRVVMIHDGRVYCEGLPREVITQTHLSAVYGAGVTVTPHPRTGRPMVLPDIAGNSPEEP